MIIFTEGRMGFGNETVIKEFDEHNANSTTVAIIISTHECTQSLMHRKLLYYNIAYLHTYASYSYIQLLYYNNTLYLQ